MRLLTPLLITRVDYSGADLCVLSLKVCMTLNVLNCLFGLQFFYVFFMVLDVLLAMGTTLSGD